ncbi:MAG: PEP-CTERM sorting domain-containing protein [Armatimonadetes bacterium]|nr:PEP-CTERM sorting domain-containing protein [Armatimonadota bacterium]
MKLFPYCQRSLATGAFFALLSATSFAQLTPPALNSNPGARYTIYLNFKGFNYDGSWAGRTPGNVPAYTIDGDANSFNGDELTAIKETWARTSQAYVGFDINVTTVDPAPVSFTDAQRKAFYDNTQYLTHTIIGGSYDWFGAAGGVSYVGAAQQPLLSDGVRTNWVFPANGTGTTPKYMTAAIIHEDGHHLSMYHQTDETTGAGYSTNGNAVGDGSYAPIMGVSYYSQRGTWRQGKAGVNDNDVQVLMNNLNMGPIRDSGIGHTLATASALNILGNGNVNSTLSKSFIMPKASTGFSASGEDSYTKDYFSFFAAGGSLTLTAHDGTSFIQNGVADPGATMRCVLRILDSNGIVLGTSTEDASTLRHTWSGSLVAGRYYAQVVSYGAYISGHEPDSRYFNMGAYFLSGSGFSPVPEPASMLGLLGGLLLVCNRKKRKS